MAPSNSSSPEGWALSKSARLSSGESVAYDIFGEGPPVVLVHGTPSRSYIWSAIVPALAKHHAVYVLDLLGFGQSRGPADQDTSIPRQARALAELIGQWGLQAPGIVGHDIGGAIVLRTHIIERASFSCIALVDAVVLRPWITPTTRHKQAYSEAYRTMPNHIFHASVIAHLRTATARPMNDTTFQALFDQWQGQDGQARYMRNLEQFDERFTEEFEPLLSTIRVRVKIIWGKRDAWLDPKFASHIRDLIPGSKLALIPAAGHFSMLDCPDKVMRALQDLFTTTLPAVT